MVPAPGPGSGQNDVMDHDERGLTSSILRKGPLTVAHTREAIPYMTAGISAMLFGVAVAVAVVGAMGGGALGNLFAWVAAVVSGLTWLAGSQMIGERAPVSFAALAGVILCAGVGAVTLGASAPRLYALSMMDEVTVTVLDRGSHLELEDGAERTAGHHVHEVQAPDGEVGYIELPVEERVNGKVESVLQDPRGQRGLTLPPDMGETVAVVAAGAFAATVFSLIVLRLTRRAARSLVPQTSPSRPTGT